MAQIPVSQVLASLQHHANAGLISLMAMECRLAKTQQDFLIQEAAVVASVNGLPFQLADHFPGSRIADTETGNRMKC